MTLPTHTRRLIALTAALAGVLAISGCQNDNKPPMGDDFAPQDETASVNRMIALQQANAARQNGNLYDNHFDGVRLNSLGEAKLNLMLRDGERDLPLVIYMDVPEDDDYKERVASVSSYLRDTGLRDSQFRFLQGPNPHDTTLAAPNIQRVKESDGTSNDLSSRPGGAGGPGGNGPAGPSGAPPMVPGLGTLGDAGK